MTSPEVFQFGIPVTSVIDSINITGQEIAFYRITNIDALYSNCLLYTSPSPRDA